MSNSFKSWFKFYLTECTGTVRGFLAGQISDASKEAYGFRTRFNAASYTLVELAEWAKEMTAIAQDAAEDRFFDSQSQEAEFIAHEFYATQVSDWQNNCWEDIEAKLERGELLPH